MASENDESKTTPAASRRPRYRRIRKKDSWLRDRYDPTRDEEQAWNDQGFPKHVDIVAGFLAKKDFIFGVPDKAEIFRLAKLAEEERFSLTDVSFKDALKLRYATPSPIPIVNHTLAHPPIGQTYGDDIVEVNYNVRIQAILRKMQLVNIQVVSGSETDDDPRVIFRGTEYPGSAVHRQIQVVEITVLAPGIATWAKVSQTTYPRSIF